MLQGVDIHLHEKYIGAMPRYVVQVSEGVQLVGYIGWMADLGWLWALCF